MSLSGPQVLNALDEALRDIRREEDDIMRKLGRSAERLAKIRDSEAELLGEIAVGRLEAEVLETLRAAGLAASRAARQTLRQRHAEMATAAARLADSDAEQARLIDERAELLNLIDEQQAALRGLSARIQAAVESDPEYGRRKQLAASLKTVAEAARAKGREADIDRELLGRPYRADPVFTYLLGRNYGTPDYAVSGPMAALDGWIARLTGFDVARHRYALLNQWPAQMHAHADRQAANAARADESIDELEQAAIDAAGGGAIRAELDGALTRIAAIDLRITELQRERNALTASQTLLTTVEDVASDRSIAALAQALGGTDVQALIAMVRQQRPGPDDPLIAQLDDARLRLSEERVDALDQHARLATLAARRRDLEDIEQAFKDRRFDDPRSQFRDDHLVGDRLSDFLTGIMSAQGYWGLFVESQGWDLGTAAWGGGVGLPQRGRDTARRQPADDEIEFGRRRQPAADAEA